MFLPNHHFDDTMTSWWCRGDVVLQFYPAQVAGKQRKYPKIPIEWRKEHIQALRTPISICVIIAEMAVSSTHASSWWLLWYVYIYIYIYIYIHIYTYIYMIIYVYFRLVARQSRFHVPSTCQNIHPPLFRAGPPYRSCVCRDGVLLVRWRSGVCDRGSGPASRYKVRSRAGSSRIRICWIRIPWIYWIWTVLQLGTGWNMGLILSPLGSWPIGSMYGIYIY
jgi:hypothetical protein